MRLLIGGIVAVIVLAAVAGGAVFANLSLTRTYSPQRAVADYFAAMGRGDAGGMMSNATFLTGDKTYSRFFEMESVVAMLTVSKNRQSTDVRIGGSKAVDDSTHSVTVALNWGGRSRILTYSVRKDPSRAHYLFYDSWRVQVPFATIELTVPNQAGTVRVDGIALEAASSQKAEVIQGFHNVSMRATDFYAAGEQLVDGVDTRPNVIFRSDLSAPATAAAATAITAAFANVTCDVQIWSCPNHRYLVPAGQYYTLPAPGGDIRANSWWSLAFRGDPTTNMTLTVATEAGKIDASGICAMTLTVDGNRTYQFVGVWTGTLTWTDGAFNSSLQAGCLGSRVA